MNKQLNWFQATLLLIPLAFIVYYIFSINFSEDTSGSLVFVLVIINFTSFFYNRRDYNYFILSVVAFYVVTIIGAIIITMFEQAWMLLFLIWTLFFTLSLTSTLTESAQMSAEKIKEEKTKRKALGKVFATPTQRVDNANYLKDTFAFIVVAIIVFLVYQHISTRYEQIHSHNAKNLKGKVLDE